VSAPEARPPYKYAAAVQVDRRLAELDALAQADMATGWAAITQRLVERQNKTNQAVVARVVRASLEDHAHRGVLVVLNDDGTVTAQLDGRVPGRTVAQLRRRDLGDWEARGCQA
jgi:hypothetical protein